MLWLPPKKKALSQNALGAAMVAAWTYLPPMTV
jgi:hypothetical protein